MLGSEVRVCLGLGADWGADLPLPAAAAGRALHLQQVVLHLLGHDRVHLGTNGLLHHHPLPCVGVPRR